MAKSLVLYFSRAGENYFGGVIKSIEKGNTQVAAETIARLADADLFRIEPKVPYSNDYRECVDASRAELAAQARPEVVALPDISAYEVVYLGYPNWCGTIPMCVATVLESLDFGGKTIRPFCTNEGSGMGASEADIKKLVPGAVVQQGLPLIGSHVGDCSRKVSDWIAKLG